MIRGWFTTNSVEHILRRRRNNQWVRAGEEESPEPSKKRHKKDIRAKKKKFALAAGRNAGRKLKYRTKRTEGRRGGRESTARSHQTGAEFGN